MIALSPPPVVQSAEPVESSGPLAERLKACKPRSERQAVDCLDRLLPAAERRALLSAEPRFAYSVRTSEVSDIALAVDEAWWVEEPSSPIDAEFGRRGFGRSGVNRTTPSTAGLLLTSFWLKAHRCRDDKPARLREYRAFQAAAAMEHAVWGYQFHPKCRDHVVGAQ
jgi:hypothetical protein